MEIFSTYQSAQNQVLKADLPHNRPFPRHWCNKKSYLYFSQKSDSNQNLDFNPVPPHVRVLWVCYGRFFWRLCEVATLI